MNVMRSSRLFRVSLFLENGSILMIWGYFSIVSNVIRSNYCCRRHTMHGNMVFSRDSIFPTPQQSGCLLECSVNVREICVVLRLNTLLLRNVHGKCHFHLRSAAFVYVTSLFSTYLYVHVIIHFLLRSQT